MKFEVVDGLAGLRAREAAWAALHERIGSASLFTSPGWVLNWIENFAPGARLHGVFASDSAGLQAVFPLVPVFTRWHRVPVTALVACTNAHSVRSALLCDPRHAPAAFAGLLQTLRSGIDWDLLLLDGCNGPAFGSPRPTLPRELPVERWEHSCLAVRGDWAQYLAGRSRDLRRNLRRAEADLAALGSMRFEPIEKDADRLFEIWASVDRASWKAHRGETVDSDVRTTAYYRRILQWLAASGRLAAGVLWLDAAPIAVIIAARDKDVLFTLKTAMRDDLSSARLSPGAVVMARMLKAAWARPGVKLIDFVSKQAYTERWTADVRLFERRVSLSHSWRGQLAGWLDRACQGVRGRTPDVETVKT